MRTRSDGSLHFSSTINIGREICLTISQLDDRADVGLVAFCLSLYLRAYSSQIFNDLLAQSIPTKNEVNIQVANYEELKDLVPLEMIGLVEMDSASIVPRTTDPTENAGVPTMVITRDDLTEDWLAGTGMGNSGHILFGQVIIEVLYNLFEGELDLELLEPKVYELLKDSVV